MEAPCADRLGVVLPDGGEPGSNVVDHLVGRAREARLAGISSVWLSQRFDHDAMTIAALIAAAVPDLAIGTAVVPIYPRHPIVVSSQAQTVQAASHGRFTLGLGLGAPQLMETSFGLSTAHPVRHLREYLTVLDSIFATGAVDLEGRTLVARTPRPALVLGAARPQVLVAAMGPYSLAAAGELADGTVTFLCGPRTLRDFIIPTIASAADRLGRPRPRIVAIVVGVVTDRLADAMASIRTATAFYNRVPSYRRVLDREGVTDPADLAIVGDEGRFAEATGDYFAAGVSEVAFVLTGVLDEEDRRRSWQLLGRLNRGGAAR